MSVEDEKRGALVQAQSAALAKVRTNALAARGRNLLRDKEEARQLLRRGKELSGAWLSRSEQLLLGGKTDERVRGHNQQPREEEKRALECYEQSFKLDPSNPEAAYLIAERYRDDFWSLFFSAGPGDEERRAYLQVVDFYRRAVRMGHLESQMRLAEFLFMHGNTEDRAEAEGWLLRATEMGNLGAQDTLDDLRRAATRDPKQSR